MKWDTYEINYSLPYTGPQIDIVVSEPWDKNGLSFLPKKNLYCDLSSIH